MSKFENVVVNGGSNQWGDHGTQNNVTHNSNHHHHHNGGGNSGKDDSGGAVIVAAAMAVVGMIWWYFNHIDQIYSALSYLSASSFVGSAIAWVILSLRKERAFVDSGRLLGSFGVATLLLGLSFLVRNHAPADIIEFSRSTKIADFWFGLPDAGKNSAMSNFMAALCIVVAALAAHFGSLRQLAYAAADSTRRGMWYGLYRSTDLFKMRFVLMFVLFFGGIAWTAINDLLPKIAT